MNDLISRQAAIDAIKRYESAYSYDLNNGLILAMNAVADVPTIDPVKHGMWICFDGKYYCSECDEEQDRKTNYCSGCGARQDISADGVKNEH